MTQVILMLPESVAREAEAAGLLRPEAVEALFREEIRRRSEQPLAPDTDRSATALQLAQALKAISRPVSDDGAALSVDPDEYPLF